MSREKRMKPGMFSKSVTLTTITVAALMLVTATGAEAVCIDKKAEFTAKRFLIPQLQNGIESAQEGESNASIVGLWSVDFLLPNGDLYDQGFEQWHSDGTELTLDNAVSPAFGNICLGVWKQVGPRTVKLTHVEWNWDANGKVAGTFWLWMTATVSRNGRSFTATFKTDSYDLDRNVIPELHAEGAVRGTRINAN